MNFKKFINSDYLKSNPLCGIDTYKDELNLATGACTRKIKKLVLTGDETDWQYYSGTNAYRYALSTIFNTGIPTATILSTHFEYAPYEAVGGQAGTITNSSASNFRCWIWSSIDNLTDFQAWLKSQYNNGTPVTVWYVLAEPTTETITVPSGLSGTEEGYLNQSGTPTPTNPIYPTANTVEKWFDTNHYIMGTDKDTLTTLPAVLYPNDVTATVGLKGDMQQSGTPTPTTPIQPQECGERTGNILPSAAEQTLTSGEITIRCDGNGRYHVYGTTSNATITIYFDIPSFVIPVSVGNGGNGTFSIFNTYTGATNTGLLLYNGSTLIDTWALNSLNRTSTAYSAMSGKTITKLAISIAPNQTIDGYISPMFTNDGILPSAYEPWGYKIPISSAWQTTPVYLGEAETTRKIKKLVLTGKERQIYSNPAIGTSNAFYMIITDYLDGVLQGFCTHYPTVSQTSAVEGVYFGKNISVFTKFSDGIDTVEKIKAYFATQYANGTPVTVWYVLATPTTGIVNEPLRKIGDYADTVSGITISTTAGANSFDVLTTLKPSEVTVNYKGWHPAQSVHERESGQWD